jgi:hypothetical protein
MEPVMRTAVAEQSNTRPRAPLLRQHLAYPAMFAWMKRPKTGTNGLAIFFDRSRRSL